MPSPRSVSSLDVCWMDVDPPSGAIALAGSLSAVSNWHRGLSFDQIMGSDGSLNCYANRLIWINDGGD